MTDTQEAHDYAHDTHGYLEPVEAIPQPYTAGSVTVIIGTTCNGATNPPTVQPGSLRRYPEDGLPTVDVALWSVSGQRIAGRIALDADAADRLADRLTKCAAVIRARSERIDR